MSEPTRISVVGLVREPSCPLGNHVWTLFPGGPPSDQQYQWCQNCGLLKVECSGDPDEYYVPMFAAEERHACFRTAADAVPSYAERLSHLLSTLNRESAFGVAPGQLMLYSWRPERLGDGTVRIDLAIYRREPQRRRLGRHVDRLTPSFRYYRRTAWSTVLPAELLAVPWQNLIPQGQCDCPSAVSALYAKAPSLLWPNPMPR